MNRDLKSAVFNKALEVRSELFFVFVKHAFL